jgi:hypothetical protein
MFPTLINPAIPPVINVGEFLLENLRYAPFLNGFMYTIFLMDGIRCGFSVESGLAKQKICQDTAVIAGDQVLGIFRILQLHDLNQDYQ